MSPASTIGMIFAVLFGAWLMAKASKIGAPGAIIVTSLIFTALHGMNPGMTAMPILNLFLASLVFSLTYYVTGSLWFVGLAHGLWNFTQGYILGSEVSGNVVDGALMASPATPGQELISGGHFGFEGGLVTTIASLVLIVVLSVIARRQAARPVQGRVA